MMSGGGGNQRQMPGSSESVPTPTGKNGGMNQTPDMSGNNRSIPKGQGNPHALPDGETPPEAPENGNSTFLPYVSGNGERPEMADNGGETSNAQPELQTEISAAEQPEESPNWFMSVIDAIINFFRSLFGI